MELVHSLISRSLLTRKFLNYRFIMSSRYSSKSSADPSGEEMIHIMKRENMHLIGINCPAKRNCVTPEAASHLKVAFENFEKDDSALVAILYGLGGTFCSGFDLKELAAGNVARLSSDDGPMGPTRMLLKKPVIAAIDGYAVAGGFQLALWCDLRVVEETAIMGVFNRRFGLPLIDGGATRLPQIVGLGRALDLILTGRGINGKEAYEMGLVTKLCKKGQALETAISLANDLCNCPQACMNTDRMSVYRATYDAKTIDEALKNEMENAVPVLIGAVKGAEKFVQGVGKHGQSLERQSLDDKQTSKL